MATRVAITGIGLSCALGARKSEVWPRLVRGENGIAAITRFDATGYVACLAGEVPGPTLPAPTVPWLPCGSLRRGTTLFLRAIDDAVLDAGLQPGVPPPARRGLAAGLSVNYVNLGLLREQWRTARAPTGSAPHAPDAWPAGSFVRRNGEWAAGIAARLHLLEGPSLTCDTACAASSHAIAAAVREIRRGRASLMIAGGGSAMVMPLGMLAFSRIGALSTNRDPSSASRPFDRRRDGFVMGEGAAALVLEPLEAARARGARVYATIDGTGATTSAHSLTDPSPDGAAEARAMQLALADAAVAPEQVGYVAAHGTSTPRNDVMETQAIRAVFGAHADRLLVSSNKGQVGHTLAAAGAVNVAVAALAIAEGHVPPTAHYVTPDPSCDLDYVPNVGRAATLDAAVANAFAFGGHNVSIVLRNAG